MNHAHTSQVGAASQTPTTTHISTPISRPNVSSATPYPSSISDPTIPNTTLSQPVTYEQFLCGELPTSSTSPHSSHALPSDGSGGIPPIRPNRGPVLRHCAQSPIVKSPDLSPNAPCFRLSPPSSHTRLTDFTINGPYWPPTRISNYIVSSENSRDSSRRPSRSTVRTRSSSFVILRSYDMFSMPSECSKPPQSVAFTSWPGESPGRFTNHSPHEELFPQRAVAKYSRTTR